MGLMTSYFAAPPLGTEAAAQPCDPDARTATFRPSGVHSDAGMPLLFVCPDAPWDTYLLRTSMQRLADALQATVLVWEWPEHGARRPRAAGYDGQWRGVSAPINSIKADVLRAFGEAAARAKAAGVPLFLLARAFGCGPAMHVLAHAPAEELALLKKVCLVSAFTSLLDLAWHSLWPRQWPRALMIAWPVVRYRNGGPDTFDNLALAKKFPFPVLLLHGKQDAQFPPGQAERLQAAMKDADLVMRPDWDHSVPWDVLIEGELRRFFTHLSDEKQH
jgi:pimeloyl-ACP methyl ester carboxylesterase